MLISLTISLIVLLCFLHKEIKCRKTKIRNVTQFNNALYLFCVFQVLTVGIYVAHQHNID